MRSLMILFFLMWVMSCSCQKDTPEVTSSVAISMAHSRDYLEIDELTGSWEQENGLLAIRATGFNAEVFSMTLTSVTDTGTIHHPSISNICFIDGPEFIPDTVSGGYIKIITCNRKHVSGVFEVILTTREDPSYKYNLEGSFSITIP